MLAKQRVWLVKHSLLVAQRLPPFVSCAKLLFFSAWTRCGALLHLSFFVLSFFCFPYLFFARPARCCNKHEVIYVLVPRQKMGARCSGKWREKGERGVCLFVCVRTHDSFFTLHHSGLDGLFQSSLTHQQMSGYAGKDVNSATSLLSLTIADLFKISPLKGV